MCKNQEQVNSTEKSNKKSVSSVLKTVIIIVLIIIIILLLLMKGKQGDNGQPSGEQGVISEEQIKMQEGELKKNPPASTADDGVALPVIADFSVSKTQPYANLFNPKDNEGKFIIKYVFNDLTTNKVVYESDWLEPGFKYSVDFGNFLDVGLHEVRVNVLTKDAANYTDRNGINTKLTITVAE